MDKVCLGYCAFRNVLLFLFSLIAKECQVFEPNEFVMIDLHIRAASVADLRAKLLEALGEQAPVQLPLPLGGQAQAATPVSLPPAPEQRKRPGRPRKAEAAEPTAPEQPAPEVAQENPTTEVSQGAEAPSTAEPASVVASTEGSVTSPSEAAPDPFSTAPAAEAPKPLTHDDARAAMGLVNEKLGMTQCMQLLQSFGVNRIGALGADKLEAFIAKCKELAS